VGDIYYHICGYPIIIEVGAAGAGTSAVLRDGGEGAGREGDSIETCPNCGEVLLLGDLTPEPVDEWW
jgi:hypothetical protein